MLKETCRIKRDIETLGTKKMQRQTTYRLKQILTVFAICKSMIAKSELKLIRT